MTTYFFCTYFDKNYCAKGLALYYSIQRHVESFRLYILCLDDETHEILLHLHLPNVELIRLKELELRDPELFATRETRSLIEYYFTITPAFILDVIKEQPEIDILSYIDADMFLFASVTPVYEEMGDNSILIIEHRFPKKDQWREISGRFNVGFLSFRRDKEGLACLELWRRQCIEWCYDRVEGERFGDQKYLDAWPSLYPKLTILKHIGVNVASWNNYNYTFHQNENGEYYVDDYPLIAYHFNSFIIHKIFGHYYYYMTYVKIIGGEKNKIKNRNILKNLYMEYFLELIVCNRIIKDTNLQSSSRLVSIRGMQASKTETDVIDFFKRFLEILMYNKNIFLRRDAALLWAKDIQKRTAHNKTRGKKVWKK